MADRTTDKNRKEIQGLNCLSLFIFRREGGGALS